MSRKCYDVKDAETLRFFSNQRFCTFSCDLVAIFLPHLQQKLRFAHFAIATLWDAERETQLPRGAKGTLISEPLFSILCDMRLFPRDAFSEGFCLNMAFSLYCVVSQWVENRGSLISVPLALRLVLNPPLVLRVLLS